MRERTSLLRILAILATPAALAACSGDGTDATTSGATVDPPGTASGPTYYKDVAPILQQRCETCHRAGDIAPFGLRTYEEAKAVSGLIAVETKARRMPPWGALETDECKPRHGWREDLRLSNEQIKMLEDWSAAGAPAGDPKDAPPAYEPPPNELKDKDMELTPQVPYVTSGDADQFRCFVMDPKLAAPSFLNGVHFVPGNRKVVHHILLFAAPKSDALTDKLDADGGYTCFGGSGVPNSKLIGAWAPGGVPNELPPNIGTPLEAGSLLVMQIHYHPAGATADPDATKVQLRFNDTPPEYHLATALIGNDKAAQAGGNGLQPGPNDGATGPKFFIPAGAADHTESMIFTMPKMIGGNPTPKIWVYSVGAHMHLVGVDQKIALDHADAAAGEECLLQEPQWNFSWQRGYTYDAAVEDLPVFAPGDKLKNRCTYDNTTDNPLLFNALLEQNKSAPVDVTMGESTLEEMCLTALGLLTKAP